MQITIWDGRIFNFDEIEKEEDLRKMSDDELRDWHKNIIDAREGYGDMDDWGLVLDEVEMLIDSEIQDRVHNPHLKNDFLAVIIDNIEDWIDKKGIRIPNEERDKEDIDNTANIYGEDFDWMMDMLRHVCCEHGIIVGDEWEN